MADRVADLDAGLWAQRFLKRMGRFAQPEARTAGRSTRRRGCGSARSSRRLPAARSCSTTTAPCGRSSAIRTWRPRRPRSASCSPISPRFPAPMSMSSAAAGASRSRSGSAISRFTLRRARLLRARAGRRVGDAAATSTLVAAPGRGAARPSRDRRAGNARRAQGRERRLALPAGRAGLRRLAGARAARRARAHAARRARPRSARPARGRGTRARGQQGRYVERLLERRAPRRSPLLAAGDDVTDGDLFRALPEGAIAIHVGIARPRRQTRLEHEYVVDSPRALRQTLRRIVSDLGGMPLHDPTPVPGAAAGETLHRLPARRDESPAPQKTPG